MPAIRFDASLVAVGPLTIVTLPADVSQQLPSRGMTMITGTMNGVSFQAALEPDGQGSHWLDVDTGMRKTVGLRIGDSVTVELEPTKQWPEPRVPEDIAAVFASNDQAEKIWTSLTPMARWDWIRWISATRQEETRQRRIENMVSMLKSGKRRPCCFNRTMCTVPSVSNNGVLAQPA